MSVQPLFASMQLPTVHAGLPMGAASRNLSIFCRAAYDPTYASTSGTGRSPHRISCHLFSSRCGRRSGCTFLARRRAAGLRPTTFQVSMEEGDSSSRERTDSPGREVNLSSHWSIQGSDTPVFLLPVFALQDSIRNVRAKGLLDSSKEGFQEAYSRFKTVDGKLVFENVIRSDAVTQGTRIWHHQEPWVKWPIAIFASLYLAVFISCGTVVAQDLVPLWIMGPVMTGLIIKSAYSAVGFAQRVALKSEPYWNTASSCTSQLYEDARKGQLVDKTRSMLELKNKEIREGLASKRSDFTLYIKSGEAATDSKAFLLRESLRFRDWILEKSEDLAEWIEPSWRSFVRLMKKLF